MSLIKNITTEIKGNIQNSRQGNISFGLKDVSTPNYLPKPTRPEELDYTLNDSNLFKKINGFVIEIQDFYDITQNCRRYTNQETLEKGIKNPYDKFKEKLLIIDILPEQLYFKCTERNRFKKLSDIPQGLDKLLNSDIETYEANWREISNNKKGLDIQTWALKTESSMGADIIMALTPFLNQPSLPLLKINDEMNIKLQDTFAMSRKEYDADPSICYSMNYSVFSNQKFTDKLIDSIYGLAELQEKRAEERDLRKSSIVFIKIYRLNTKQTQCRDNFKTFLNSIPNIRDTYDLNYVFLDCTNLQGQLFLSCGADLFSERTTGRANITTSDGGMGFGRIYVAEDGYYTNISYDEYGKKFKKNGNKPLCNHEYCSKTLKNDVSNDNYTNYNKESRRIHQMLSRFDDIDEILKGQKGKSLRDIKFKIGHSNDASLNYLNPYN
jgi:hypothetical protein